jgi:hypothetical protein
MTRLREPFEIAIQEFLVRLAQALNGLCRQASLAQLRRRRGNQRVNRAKRPDQASQFLPP